MPIFDFTLVVDCLDASDPEQIDRLFSGGCGDAVPVFRDGVTTIGFAREAAVASDALWSAVDDIERSVPGARVVHLDDDLVNLTEIAARSNVKRQAARLWAEGKRRNGFPKPETWVGDMRLWRWSDVYEWLRGIGRPVDEDFVPVDKQTCRCFDAAVLTRRPSSGENWHRLRTPPSSPPPRLHAGVGVGMRGAMYSKTG